MKGRAPDPAPMGRSPSRVMARLHRNDSSQLISPAAKGKTHGTVLEGDHRTLSDAGAAILEIPIRKRVSRVLWYRSDGAA